MARRKRASMREGPLADLFRATVDPEDPPEAPTRGERPPAEDETGVMREQQPRAVRESRRGAAARERARAGTLRSHRGRIRA